MNLESAEVFQAYDRFLPILEGRFCEFAIWKELYESMKIRYI